jgi:Domain of unknown function (DUF2341).
MTFVRFAAILIGALLALSSSCSHLTGGAGGETTNGCVQGFLFNDDGSPALHARVTLTLASHNPVIDPPVPDSLTDTTGPSGSYTFATSLEGVYTIEAVDAASNKSTLITNITIAKKDTVFAPPDTLRKPGTITAMLPDSVDALNGYVYVPGTGIFTFLSGNTSVVVFNSVPAEKILTFSYAINGSAVQPKLFAENIRVMPGDTLRVVYSAWLHRQKVYLNTTPAGAVVSGDIAHFPVLVRLNGTNFDFTGALGTGKDVCFTKSDNTPLPFELSRWDAVNKQAELWVKVDTIYGNNDTQYFVMYWGNSSIAASASNSAAVFDTAAGFQGVWHLDEAGSATANDATGNHYNGVPAGMSAASAVTGVIGIAQEFNGSTGYIAVPNTASSRLNFPENGAYTLSAWVYADSFDYGHHQILSKGDRQYGLQLHNNNEWEMFEFDDATGWKSVYAPATEQAWKYIVGVRNGANEYLYVDGVLANDSIIMRDTTGRNTGFDLNIGRRTDSPSDRYWKGKIDEICVSDVIRSADWIKLCFMNQKAVDVLISFK